MSSARAQTKSTTVSYSDFLNYLRNGEIIVKCRGFSLIYQLVDGKLFSGCDFSNMHFPSEYTVKELYEEYLESSSQFKFSLFSLMC